MRIISIRNPPYFAKSIKTQTPTKNKKSVESILLEVKRLGDNAVKRYEKKFSGVKLTSFRVSKKEIKSAFSKVSKEQLTAIRIAKKRLAKTESALKKQLKNVELNANGIKISKSFVPLESVGCYVPGGLARYPSSLVMCAVPAKIAGVKRIVVVSPPTKQGMIDPMTLVTSDVCGVDEVYKMGGAQAIAALAYGTKSVKQVDKIVGPGGPVVTTAKSLVSENTSIDMIAGPTELGIIADNSANPSLVAADLISQAEHSSETFCFLITNSKNFAINVNHKIKEKVQKVKRKKIIKNSLKNNGFIAVCKTKNDMIQLANELAPEHLEVITKKPTKISSQINTAGLILIGQNTPSSASDYLLGSNHILPTNRFGKARGSLSVLDFVKLRTQVESSKLALQKISKYVKEFSFAEGLPNHNEALRSRLL